MLRKRKRSSLSDWWLKALVLASSWRHLVFPHLSVPKTFTSLPSDSFFDERLSVKQTYLFAYVLIVLCKLWTHAAVLPALPATDLIQIHQHRTRRHGGAKASRTHLPGYGDSHAISKLSCKLIMSKLQRRRKQCQVPCCWNAPREKSCWMQQMKK